MFIKIRKPIFLSLIFHFLLSLLPYINLMFLFPISSKLILALKLPIFLIPLIIISLRQPISLPIPLLVLQNPTPLNIIPRNLIIDPIDPLWHFGQLFTHFYLGGLLNQLRQVFLEGLFVLVVD